MTDARSAGHIFVRRACAKVNLDLRVGRPDADGYHPLSTVFQTIALHDTLTFEPCAGEPFALSCDDPAVPADERNLVWRAAAAVWSASGRAGEPRGVRVHLRKGIPAQGGLGGGSADAGVSLVAFDAVWRTALGRDRLTALAARLGADVAFFLVGGTARGTGRGDRLEPWPDLPHLEVVLALPPFGVATGEAYRWLDEAGRLAEPAELGAPAAPPLDWREWLARGRNDLEPAVFAQHPLLGDLCEDLRARGAVQARMSGSGSTVFGLFTRAIEADAAAAALGREGVVTCRSHTLGRERYVAGAFGPAGEAALPLA
jgi:4-diphosphocytidyl-2-C-methyl-D-erythritol kinase